MFSFYKEKDRIKDARKANAFQVQCPSANQDDESRLNELPTLPASPTDFASVSASPSEKAIEAKSSSSHDNEPPLNELPASPTEYVSVSTPEMDGEASPRAPTTWYEALVRACRDKNSLMQSPRQVLQNTQDTSSGFVLHRPSVDAVIVYSNPSATAKAIVAKENMQSKEPASSSSGWLLSGVVTGVSWTVSKVKKAFLDEDDYEEDELAWNQDQDHGVDSNVDKLVDWNQQVVCIELVQKCLSELLPQTTALTALYLRGTKRYSFTCWACDTCPFLQATRRNDLELIVHVLVESDHAVLYDDCIVFGNTLEEKDCEVPVALLKVKQAAHDTEQQLQEWEQRQDECTRLAKGYKRDNNQKAALRELQKKKLLEGKIGLAHGSLQNLQQAENALEMAQLQHTHVFRALEATANALKALRLERSVEDIEELHEDLQEEYEHSRQVEPALFKVNDSGVDDEELLRELSELSTSDIPNEAGELLQELSKLSVTDVKAQGTDAEKENHQEQVQPTVKSKREDDAVATRAMYR